MAIWMKSGAMTPHDTHVEAVKRLIFGGGGGEQPGPGPGPEPTPGIEEKFLTFRDWDGTILHSYTREEADALTELPPLPDHSADELLGGEWNWTLEELQAAAPAAAVLTVGALYDTPVADETGRRYTLIDVAPDRWSKTVTMASNRRASRTIDWGDGTTEATDAPTVSHTYSDTTPRTIRIVCEDWCWSLDSDSSRIVRRIRGGWKRLLPVSTAEDAFNPLFWGRNLQAVSLPKEDTLSPRLGYVYNGAPGLRHISIPRVTTVDKLPSIQAAGWAVRDGLSIAWPGTLPAPDDNAPYRQPDACLLHDWPSLTIALASRHNCRIAPGGRVGMSWQATPPVIAQGVENVILGPYTALPEYAYMEKVTTLPSVGALYLGDRAMIGQPDLEIPADCVQVRAASINSDFFAGGDIHLRGTTPPALQSVSGSYYGARFFVPAAALDTYKRATNWIARAAYIYAEEE